MKKASKIVILLVVLLFSFNFIACNNNANTNDSVEYPYTVTFDTAGGSLVEGKNTDVILYAPTSFKENHILEGWYYDSAKTIPVNFPLSVDTNLTLYAKWKETLKSVRNRFEDYMKTFENKIEKERQEDSFTYKYSIENIGYFITYGWQQTYISPFDSENQTIITYEIRFEFGDFTTAKGTAVCFYKTGSNFCHSSYNFYSARVEGNTWLLNLNHINTTNTSSIDYNSTEIGQDIQNNLLGALNDIRSEFFLTGLSFSAILDYKIS